MVFALETYCPASDGESAARIEEEVVVTATGFRVITKALESSKSTDAAKVRAALGALKDFPGFTGKIGFNAKGDRVGELYRVYAVDEAGGFVLQK